MVRAENTLSLGHANDIGQLLVQAKLLANVSEVPISLTRIPHQSLAYCSVKAQRNVCLICLIVSCLVQYVGERNYKTMCIVYSQSNKYTFLLHRGFTFQGRMRYAFKTCTLIYRNQKIKPEKLIVSYQDKQANVALQINTSNWILTTYTYYYNSARC